MTGHGGLSGEHIQLCAEGARFEKAESLRQTDGDKQTLIFIFCVSLPHRSSPIWAAFFFCNSKTSCLLIIDMRLLFGKH